MLFVAIGLVYPAIRTSFLAFQDNSGDWTLDNFIWMFTQPTAIRTLINTIIWVLLVPTIATAVGLAYAVFIDKSRGRGTTRSSCSCRSRSRSSGASVIWRFVYEYRSGEREQIGLLNAIVVAFGGEPVQWLQTDPINTILLIVVMIWIQTGFAMVLLSAAIKGVPTEQIEAAQLDGTNAWQRFTNVTVPGIRGCLVVVLTTISIATLKVFDIVRTMTAGNFNTSVVANEMYTQAFRASEVGRGRRLRADPVRARAADRHLQRQRASQAEGDPMSSVAPADLPIGKDLGTIEAVEQPSTPGPRPPGSRSG